MRTDFCAFILSYARPSEVLTVGTILRQGYTGAWYIILGDDDPAIEAYIEIFGEKHIIIFNKKDAMKISPGVDNFNRANSVLYARNACWGIAKKLGYKYFIELDDDYPRMYFRRDRVCLAIRNLDKVFSIFIKFLETAPDNVKTICFAQAGDYIGGYDARKLYFVKRKAMNSFICRTANPFYFIGILNDDVNTYMHYGGVGDLFLTVWNIMLVQKETQMRVGGLTDIYKSLGTYVKSFYTVILRPSCTTIDLMGRKFYRLHHKINWDYAVPCIIPEEFKK